MQFFSPNQTSTAIGKELSALLALDDVTAVTYLFQSWMEYFGKSYSSPTDVSTWQGASRSSSLIN